MSDVEVSLETLTKTAIPDGAEGVIRYNSKYYWYNFTPSMYFSVHYDNWEEDTDKAGNGVLLDFREIDNAGREVPESTKSPENSGLSCNYYVVDIDKPTSLGKQYTAECNDIIEALGMNAQEGNIFKEIWRTSAARNLGKEKAGHTAKRGAEKVAFFGLRYALQNGVQYNDLIKTLKEMKVHVQ